jgi:hypothetical protein
VVADAIRKFAAAEIAKLGRQTWAICPAFLCDSKIQSGIIKVELIMPIEITTVPRKMSVPALDSSGDIGSPAALVLYYMSLDCTGTRYVLHFSGVMPTIAYAIVVHSIACIAGTTQAQSYPGSASNASGTCSTSGIPMFGAWLPVIATFDLSTLNFIPPYSVQ